MLTISKLKELCVFAYIVPRLFRGNVRNIPSRFEKSCISTQRKADKSSDSGTKESDYERCQRIIDRAFKLNSSLSNSNSDPVPERSLLNLVTPGEIGPDSQYEKCQRIINQIFGEDTNAELKKRVTIDQVYLPISELQATIANENEETLAQKVEVINETPLVEAHANEKVEGFNVQPKVLGNINEQEMSQTIQTVCCSSDKTIHGRGSRTCKQDDTFDELAKRCLDSPSHQIDQRILKEIEKLGVPPSTRKGSRRTAKDEGIVQPEIMRRPRRPVEKTELDYLSRMSRLRKLKRLNDVLPPPFELVPMKTVSPVNSVNFFMSCDAEDNNDNNLYMERMQPYHVTNCLPKDVKDCISPVVENKDEKLQQEMLGQITAAVMSDKTDEIEQSFVDRQERLNYIHDKYLDRNDDGTEISNKNEDFSQSTFKEKDIAVPREKIATTNFLSDFVDPNDISPQPKPTGFMKEYIEIETLRKILQTRSEHLADFIAKSHQLKEITKKIITDSPVTKSNADDQEDMELLLERINPYYSKKEPNIMSKETTEPCILIREIVEDETSNDINGENSNVQNETMKIMGNKNASLKSYSLKQKSITPHQLFEQISLISRETELGTRDDYQELESRQLLQNLGVASNDPPVDKSLADKNFMTKGTDGNQNIMNPFIHENSLKNIDSDAKLFKESTLLTSSELSRRALTEEETDEPVIAVELGRLDSPTDKEQQKNLYDVPFVSASNRGPVLRTTTISNNDVAQGTFMNPLLDKGAVGDISTPNMNAESSSTIPKNHAQKPLALSEMLKRVRERSMIEMYKRITELKFQNAQVDPIVGECESKNSCSPPACTPPRGPSCPPKDPPCPPKDPPCPPKQPPCPPKQPPCPPKQPPCPPKQPPCPQTRPPCPPPETPCPSTQPPCTPKQPPCPPKEPPKEPCDPCKPKSPPAPCSPAKPRCPPRQPRYPRKQRCPQKKPICPQNQPPCNPCQTKCPPTRKSPCEKFRKPKCSTLKIQDVLTLLLYSGPKLHVPKECMLPALRYSIKNPKSEAVKQMCTKLQEQCNFVLMPGFSKSINALESVAGNYNTSINYARTYDPWCPIPSWKIPVKEEKKKIVCPNKGCPVIPPKKDACELSPCKNFPRHNKFKLLDFIINYYK